MVEPGRNQTALVHSARVGLKPNTYLIRDHLLFFDSLSEKSKVSGKQNYNFNQVEDDCVLVFQKNGD
jgi:hypothetical protein